KPDGRIGKMRPDGSERALAGSVACPITRKLPAATGAPPEGAYARGVRARSKLTQAEFGARIGVPIETVRNWEQGKRSPRGPARALLKVIDEVPEVAFAVLSTAKP